MTMHKNMLSLVLIAASFYSGAALADHPFKVGDRIEYTRYADRRSTGTLVYVVGDSLTVIEDGEGQQFSFVISPTYAASYNVQMATGAAAAPNPEHQYVEQREPAVCPELKPEQGDVPGNDLLRQLIVCWFEDQSDSVFSSRPVNVEILSFEPGRPYRAGNTLMYVDPSSRLTPARVRLNEITYNYDGLTRRLGAVYDFLVYVDYNNNWVVAPSIIEMGRSVDVPKP